MKPPKVAYGAKKRQDGPTTKFDLDGDDSPRPRKRNRKSSGSGRDAEDNYKGENENFTSLEALDGQGPLEGSGGSTDDLWVEKPQKQADQKDSSSGQPMLPPLSRSSGTIRRDVEPSSGSTIPFTDPPSLPPRHFTLGCGSPGKSQSAESDGLESLTSTRAQRKTRKRAASELESPKVILGEEVAPSSSAPAESPVKRPRRNFSQPNHASFTSPTKSDGGHDELSLSVASSPTSIRKNSTSRKKASRHSRPTSEEPENDLLPDIPAETYQARPSRSRSTRSTDDLLIPTDFSKRPEALAKPRAKAKGKSRKTDPSERTGNEDPSVQPDDTEDSNSLARTEDNTMQDEHNTKNEAEDGSPVEDPPTPPPKPPKKSRGRPKKEANTKQTTTTVDSQKPAGNTAEITELPAPAKRGRKRKTLISEDVVHEDAPSISEDAEIATDTHGPPLATDSNVFKEGDGNIIISQQDADLVPATKKKSDAMMVFLKKANTDTPSCKIVQNQASTPKSESKENGTKALYRVGLSKRQRIAPLLRVVRK